MRRRLPDPPVALSPPSAWPGLRRRWLARALAAAAVAWVVPIEARSPGFTEAVNRRVAEARRIAPELGVLIVERDSGATVYSFREETRLLAASNTKLFTTAAAIDRLGPGFFFETELWIRGAVEAGTLRGALAVIGGGDPNLSGRHYFGDSYGAFREWAAALKGRGIERIAGGLTLVHGLFDQHAIHPDWPIDQLDRWYQAPVSALSFNDNCVLVRVRPNGTRGGAAEVTVEPALPIFALESSAKTSSRRRSAVRVGRRPEAPHVLTVGGWVSQRAPSFDRWVAVPDPVRYFGAALRAALAEEGIEVVGGLHPATRLPEGDWRPLLTHRSDLLTTLEIINKRSQNLHAESLLKLLGARVCGDGSWRGGLQAVREFLSEIGLEVGDYQLADGSGLSRHNRFSARQVVALLRHMATHRWGREFQRTLPHSGERDLKWEDRLADPPYRGNVLAKTGTLRGVSALSGYAKARSGTVYAFSILMNRARTNWQATDAQDRIVRALIDHG